MEYMEANNGWEEEVSSPEQWESFAGRLLAYAGKATIMAFSGPLGAGKTSLIREICRQLEVSDVVASPTFAIIYEYHTMCSEVIYHMDFYRINRLEEVYDMGYEDYFYSGNLCFIEWPELVVEILPPETLWVDIRVKENGLRVARVSKERDSCSG